MVKNLIIRTSYAKLPNNELKPNFGDLIRSTILIDCIGKDFFWLTDQRSINLLKHFIDHKRIINIADKNLKDLSFDNIYNLDNYIVNKEVFKKIKGKWHGYIFDGKEIFPENKLITITAPPYNFRESWQQKFIESFGFKWEEQDYPLVNTKEPTVDVGFNWHSPPDWIAKKWPEENWKKLEKVLEKKYSVSWQQGLNDFDEYIEWLSSCKIIVTCESLGLHLASALRKEVISIVGPTEGKEYHYNRLYSVFPAPRECMPCNLKVCKFDGKETCLDEISPQEVSKMISNIISSR